MNMSPFVLYLETCSLLSSMRCRNVQGNHFFHFLFWKLFLMSSLGKNHAYLFD
jgi:hypothetical protein